MKTDVILNLGWFEDPMKTDVTLENTSVCLRLKTHIYHIDVK